MRQEKPGWMKWFSLSRHKRRKGADAAMKCIDGLSLHDMSKRVIEGDEARFTHGADADLAKHIENLRSEFVGQPELNYWVASCIVLIRREVATQKNVDRFFAAFESYREPLIASLNTRWLVSCADTFADFHPDPLERAYALAVSGVVNSVKLAETERVVRGASDQLPDVSQLDMERERISLWDGTSAFAIGTDDTIRNYCWRLDRVKAELKELPTMLTLYEEVFHRLSKHQTVYGRFKHAHRRERTQWW